MAIQVADNFSYQGKKPLDGRTEYGTIAAMVAVSESILNDGCLAYVKENKKYYTFDSNNTIDSTLGKWREFESGSTITVDPTPTSESTNAVQSGGTYTALEGKVDKVNGKGLSTEDFTTAEKTKLDGINLSNYVPTSQKGEANGVATLGSTGKIPMSQIPNGLDETIMGYRKEADGLFYEDAEFTTPITPQAGLFYYDELSTNFYRWNGSAFVSFTDGSTGLVIGEVTGTAYDGGKGKANRDAIAAIKDGQTIDSFADVETALANKVDKVTGKGLSTNDYDNTEKGKVTDAQPKTLATAKTIEGASVTTVQGVADAVQTHTNKVVTGTDGVHGFKVTTNGGTKMYYKSGDNWVEIEVGSSTQVSTLPTASQSNVGVVYQYIGSTTSAAPIYKHGYFYECVENSGVYSWVNIPVMDVQEVQKTTLPTASATELGNIYQFVGTTTSSYTKGYYYECKAKGTEPETYEWQAISVQAGGSGADSRIGEEITKIGVRQEGIKLIPYIRFKYNVPPFNTLSWSNLGDLLQMYYNGDISIEEIQNAWSLGDSIPISFSDMQAMPNFDDTHSAQTNEMQIVDFNTYNIENTETKCLLTLQMKDCFNEKGKIDIARIPGNTWLNEPRRTWCRDYVYPSLSADVKALIKNVERTTDVVDNIFIPTSKEVMNYLPSGGTPTFGTLYEYYETQANRVKKIDGTIEDYFCSNQTGQSSVANASFYPIVTTNGSGTTADMDTLHGLAIAFCI